MKTIALTSRKGGSGKTTLTVQVALEAHRRGYGVVVADTDPQRSSFEMLREATDGGLQVMVSNGAKLGTLQAACGRASIDLFIIDTPAVMLDEGRRCGGAERFGRARGAAYLSRPCGGGGDQPDDPSS